MELVFKETALESPADISFVTLSGGSDVSDTVGSTTSRLKFALGSNITVVFVNS